MEYVVAALVVIIRRLHWCWSGKSGLGSRLCQCLRPCRRRRHRRKVSSPSSQLVIFFVSVFPTVVVLVVIVIVIAVGIVFIGFENSELFNYARAPGRP